VISKLHGMIVTFARTKRLALALVAGVLLAGCVSQATQTVSLPVSIRLGPAGRQFKASFPHTPTMSTYKLSGAMQPQYGVGVQTNTTYVSGGNGPSAIIVWIVSLTNSVPPRRVDPFMRSYLANHGGRIVKWFGLPAAEEFAPGCNPSGQCVGTVGNLVVLDGTTLYFVFAHENSMTAAQEEVRSFRVVR
jgi:hypothetical protein